MNNLIQYGLDRIYREIPEHVLNLAFGQTVWGFQNNRVSLESSIRSQVIDGIIMSDLNLVSSNVITVALVNLNWEYLETGIRIRIPATTLNNRNIISVLSLEVINSAMEPYQQTEGTPGRTGTTSVYLVAPNTIFLTENPGSRYVHLRCTVENEQQLNNIPQRSYLDIGDLILLACKLYIYNKLSININVTSMNSGQIDGRLREIIDGYSDASTMYGELLSVKIRKINLLSDRVQHHRLIRLGISG